MPIPSGSSSNCSDGSSRRGVKPAAWSRRQKSLRGFAKWALAASEKRPGLIPQKTTREPGREHVGDGRGRGRRRRLCRFGLARLEARLEREPDPLGQSRW